MVDFACVALVDPRGYVLLQERDGRTARWPDRWAFPGGAVEVGESGYACAVREVAEETGVQLDPARLTSLGVREVEIPDGRIRQWEFFVARTELGQDDVQCFEGRQMVFRDPADWAHLPMVPTTEYVLDMVRAWIHANPPTLGERRFAGVLLSDPDGRLLLQERDEHPAIDPECWGLPGGHVEPGETFAQAAPRELAEETGLVLADGELTLWREFVVDHRAAHGTWDRMQVFTADVDLTDQDVDCREGRRIVFVDPDAALALPLTRAAAAIVPAFLSARRGSSAPRTLQP